MMLTPPGWWNADIIVYRRYTDANTDVTTWMPSAYSRCSWRNVRSAYTRNEIAQRQSEIVVRIPYAGKALPPINPGDVIVRRGRNTGNGRNSLSNAEMHDLQKSAADRGVLLCNVLEVSDNTNDAAGLPHVRLRCG